MQKIFFMVFIFILTNYKCINMNKINRQSPNFQMKVQGLENSYFAEVPQKLKNTLIQKAAQVPNTDFIIYFMPTSSRTVFLQKIQGGTKKIVEYFPPAYTPEEIVKTFITTYIPSHRILAKSLINESQAFAAQKEYKKIFSWVN